jgi:hypothetical protein
VLRNTKITDATQVAFGFDRRDWWKTEHVAAIVETKVLWSDIRNALTWLIYF